MDLIGLIPSFGSVALTVAAFIVALTVIVAVHEYGHYIIGRISGIKADVFSIGIGPVLVSRTDRHGTRWQIAALPVGGYVKFHGDANAASGTVDESALAGMSDGERRQTLHGAPLWARAATVAAGPIFNFILSALIFTGFLMSQGIATDPLSVAALKDIPGLTRSLEPGDEILAIDGKETPELAEFSAYVETLPAQSPLEYLVRRDGAQVSVSALHPYPPFVSGLSPQSAAVDAGLKVNDLITHVNGQPVATFEELRQIVVNGDGAEVALEINRAGETLNVTLAPRRVDLPKAEGGFETRWLIGITGGLMFEPMTQSPGVIKSLTYGADQTAYIVEASISGLYSMITGAISSCNLRGPIGIAQTSGQAAAQGVGSFIWFIAVLSTAVGLLNLFPIPILDGGHLVFHAWEAVTGNPPSDRALRFLMSIGLFLILGLMGLGLVNDLFCP